MYSPRIYLYKITFEEVPYYYYGVHKEKRFDEKYWGSPYTHKWCWDFYIPKKQILEIFDYTDEGWWEAQEVERRLIRPVFNTDKWCLNESCGGIISLEVYRKTGIKNSRKLIEEKKGIFSLTKEELSELGKKGGVIGGKKGGKISGQKTYEQGIGIHGQSKEKMTENGKKGVKIVNSQKWMCLETGYVSTAAGIVSHQKGRRIDTSKSNRKRIS